MKLYLHCLVAPISVSAAKPATLTPLKVAPNIYSVYQYRFALQVPNPSSPSARKGFYDAPGSPIASAPRYNSKICIHLHILNSLQCSDQQASQHLPRRKGLRCQRFHPRPHLLVRCALTVVCGSECITELYYTYAFNE